MPEKLFYDIPIDIIKFLLVVVFSFLIGLEQRRHHINEEFESLFGTDRTFTLIGILGFILYVISPQTLLPFLGGGAVIALLIAIYYSEKIKIQKEFGVTSLVIVFITYCLAPLVYTQSEWMVLLIVVSVLTLTEIKKWLFDLSKKIDENEFITLAKFLVIAGVVLPLLPDKPVSSVINISLYKLWLAIVAVSGISYFSYLLKKFVFPNAGIILTGILGGLYSSTATTVILARKSKELGNNTGISAAIILATTMMYLRIFLLALFFNPAIAQRLTLPFVVLIVVSLLTAFYIAKFNKAGKIQKDQIEPVNPHVNPLEFKTAIIFGVLFIFFAFITGYVNRNYGTGGIKALSFVVGVTDIDPFIINLLQSKWNIGETFLVIAAINATTSNNFLKMIYGITLGDGSIRRQLIVGFSILIITGLLISFVFLS
jgi:uncharacterized membrane protein (DUF4010 family)